MLGVDSLLRRSLSAGVFSAALFAAVAAAPGTAGAQEKTEDDRTVPGRLERAPSELRTEKLLITVDEEGRAMLRELGAREYLTRLLQQNEIPVNGLLFDPDKLMERFEERGEAQCYHVVYPDAERSNTICF